MFGLGLLFVTSVLSLTHARNVPTEVQSPAYSYEHSLEAIIKEMADCLDSKLGPFLSKLSKKDEDNMKKNGISGFISYVKLMEYLAMKREDGESDPSEYSDDSFEEDVDWLDTYDYSSEIDDDKESDDSDGDDSDSDDSDSDYSDSDYSDSDYSDSDDSDSDDSDNDDSDCHGSDSEDISHSEESTDDDKDRETSKGNENITPPSMSSDTSNNPDKVLNKPKDLDKPIVQSEAESTSDPKKAETIPAEEQEEPDKSA